RVVALANRYPNASFAVAFWERLDKERAASPRELVDASLFLGPLPPGGLKLGASSIEGDGLDGLVCQDVDGNRVWEYRSHAPPDEGASFNVVGAFLDRLVALEMRKGSGASLSMIDLATGSDVGRIELSEVTEAPH